MGRRSLGLALLSLALVAPASATASAKAKPEAAAPYKVLVVTSTQDALSTAGVNAINQAVGAATASSPHPRPPTSARSSRPRASTPTARSCS